MYASTSYVYTAAATYRCNGAEYRHCTADRVQNSIARWRGLHQSPEDGGRAPQTDSECTLARLVKDQKIREGETGSVWFPFGATALLLNNCFGPLLPQKRKRARHDCPKRRPEHKGGHSDTLEQGT